MAATAPSIAIIGAGPGGLVVARLLHLANVPFTFYEGEPDRDSRPQGGTLDLHPESGQRALKEAQLHDEFKKVARSEGEDMRVADKTGKLHYEEVDSEGHDRPEVDRLQLRRILLDSLPANAIQWGSKIRSIIATTNETYEIHIEHPTGPRTATHTLLIGADGAWSKVRPLLSDTKPHYSTISTLDMRIRSIDSTHPHLSSLVGRGTYLAFSDYKGIIAQRNGDGSVRIYAMLQKSEDWLQSVNVDWTDERAAKEFLLKEEYHDWDDELRDLIRYADKDITPRAMYQLPTDFAWTHRPGVTLLGDAAHLMTPFGGEGVNLAMLDALELSHAIINAVNPPNTTEQGKQEENTSARLAKAIETYEKGMWERCHESMEMTWRNLELFFQKDAPREFVREFEKMMAERGGGSPPAGAEGMEMGMPNPKA